MNLNTQKLQYILEIAHTGSISQAATNLYMAQSNLSRILKELEDQIGFQIFERSGNGVTPTKLGTQFLLRAESILADALFIQELAQKNVSVTKIFLCIPFSYKLINQYTSYFTKLFRETGFHLVLEECDAQTALEHLETGRADLALIRYPQENMSQMKRHIKTSRLKSIRLSTTNYQLLLNHYSPLIRLPSIHKKDLQRLLYIDCTTCESPDMTVSTKKITTNNRMAQLQMLSALPNAYTWVDELPQDILDKFNLIQHPCHVSGHVYQNLLVYKENKPISEEFRQIIDFIENSLNTESEA